MTSHELAKLLLEGEDLPVVVWRDDGSDESLEIKDLPVKMYRFIGTDDTIFAHELAEWKLGSEETQPVLEFQVY